MENGFHLARLLVNCEEQTRPPAFHENRLYLFITVVNTSSRIARIILRYIRRHKCHYLFVTSTISSIMYPIIIITTFVFGCAFFFGFYFGMIEKDIDHNDDIDDWIARTVEGNCTITGLHLTAQERCVFNDFDTNEYHCSHRHSCNSCGCSGTSCTTLENSAQISGACCNSVSCCTSYTCCDGCYIYEEYEYYDSCCTRTICCGYSVSQCRVDWGSCWDIMFNFTMLAAGDRAFSNEGTDHCGYQDAMCVTDKTVYYAPGNEVNCWYKPGITGNANVESGAVSFTNPSTWTYYVYFFRNEFPAAVYTPYEGSGTSAGFDSEFSKFSGGNGTTLSCWYDPHDNSVIFYEPDGSDKVNEDRGWAGATFGLAGWCVCIAFTVIWIIKSAETCDRERSFDDDDGKYVNKTFGGAENVEISTVSSVPNGGNDLPVATATAIPSSGL